MKISIATDVLQLSNNIKSNDIGILITGDFCPKLRIAELIDVLDFKSIFNDFMEFSTEAALSVTNLECPLTNQNNPIIKAGPVLKGPIETAEALKYAGFKLVTLANNHIMDHGKKALIDTIELLEREGINYVGAGKSIHEAEKPFYFECQGSKIAILNITEHEFSIASDKEAGAAPLDEVRNYYNIIKTKEKSDFLILIIHGGHEGYNLPSPRMKKVYRYFADIGADVIVGHHAHAFTGYEIYNEVPIIYNIGNFIFDRKKIIDDSWHIGFAVFLFIKENNLDHIYLIPYKQCKEIPGVHILHSEELLEFSENISRLNGIIVDSETLLNEFNSFVRSRKVYYLSTFLGLNKFSRKLLKLNIFNRFLFKKRRILNHLNHIRCQSHCDILTDCLKQESK